MDLQSLLAPVSVEDIIAKRVRVVIDGVTYTLSVKPMRAHREWEERLDVELVALLNTVREDGDDVSAILRALSLTPGRFIDLLLSYDDGHVLPDRDTVESVETELGLLVAVLEVWRAAHPLVAIGIEALATASQPISALPRLTSSLLPSGDSPMTGSKVN